MHVRICLEGKPALFYQYLFYFPELDVIRKNQAEMTSVSFNLVASSLMNKTESFFHSPCHDFRGKYRAAR